MVYTGNGGGTVSQIYIILGASFRWGGACKFENLRRGGRDIDEQCVRYRGTKILRRKLARSLPRALSRLASGHCSRK